MCNFAIGPNRDQMHTFRVQSGINYMALANGRQIDRRKLSIIDRCKIECTLHWLLYVYSDMCCLGIYINVYNKC